MNTTELDEKVTDQAYAWVVALRGENVSDKNLEEFADWLASTDVHQLAWNQALDVWETLGAIANLPLEELMIDDSDRAKISSDKKVPMRFSLFENWGRLWKPIALAFSLATVGLFTVFNLQPEGEIYTAGVGQYLAVTLVDGSVVELNTDTEISVSFTEDSRDLELLKGEVFFTVAADKDKPFTVSVAGATIQAVGTAFNIHRFTNQSAILTVVEGIVRVQEAAGSSVSSAQSKLLTVNEAMEIDSVLGLSESHVSQLHATAWRQGLLLFDNTSINDAVEMLNRYMHQKVIVADDVSKSIKISGTFSSRQNKETLAAVAQALSLELTPLDNKWLLSQSSP